MLCDYSCAYCWTNAGDTSMYNTPLEERMGTAAFLELFEDRPLFPKRNALNIPDWFPTNPQAEVLVFGSISINYIENVYFENYNSLFKHKNIIPTGISYNIKTEVFKYRKDWSFW